MSETSDSETTEKKDDDARKETNLPEGNTEAESLDNPETDKILSGYNKLVYQDIGPPQS